MHFHDFCLFLLIFLLSSTFLGSTNVPSACVQVATSLFVSEEELFIQLINSQLQNIGSDKQFPQVGFFSDYTGRKYTDLNLR